MNLKAKINVALCLIIGIVFTSCSFQTKEQDVIGKQKVEIENGRLSPEVLWAMGRLGEVSVSPNGKEIVYSVRYFSVKENKGNTDLYIMEIDGSKVKRLTETSASEYNIQWMDNKTIAFLKNGQIQKMNINSKAVEQISNDPHGIEGFKFNSDFTKVAIIKQVKSHATVADRYSDLDKSSGMVFNELNYRHWDHWVFTKPHIFVADFTGVTLANTKDLLDGQPYESPVKPFGGIEQFAWSADSKYIAYTSRKLTGTQYVSSTNTDIYLYELSSGSTINITEGMLGYDKDPVFSPDGKYIAWQSMERDGYEADKNRLFVMDLDTKKKYDASKGFDQNVYSLAWAADSKKIYFTSNYYALTQIYSMDLEKVLNEKYSIAKITDGVHDYISVIPVNNDLLIGARMSMSTPAEIFSIEISKLNSVKQTQISKINADIMDKLKLGKVEERWITTTDNKSMLTWIIYPPDFDPKKKYATLLYCQGGPQSTVSQFWSFRWNFQIMAANDYIIVAPNRRGLPGFGQEWLEQISGDYGGQNMKDYLSAIDEMSKEPYVDKDRLGCVGASYGGFSVFWLAGHHENRFKGFISHDGMFNLDQQYLETEEMWFVNWDLGGAYWDKNPTAQRSYKNSPHLFVDKWNTPIFVIHGEKDFRIVASQSMAAFNAAKLRGIEAELLIFPDENHWVLKPQNGILWQRRFFKFLDTHVKGLGENELKEAYHGENDVMLNSVIEADASDKEKNTETQVAQ